MASQGPPPPPDSGIDLTTLFLSAVASAVAAYVVSKIWAPGTLFSAAFTPVIVALVKEGLRKPTQAVASVASVATPSRWTRTGPDEAGLVPDDTALQPPRDPGAPVVDPDAPHVLLPPVVASGEHGPVKIYSTRSRRWRWRVALITGLLGFAVALLAFTVPELIAGKSIGRGGGHATTFFGGHKRGHSPTTKTTTSTTKTTNTTTTPSQTTTTETTPDDASRSRTTPSSSAPPSTSTPSSTTPQPSTAAPPSSAAPQGTATPQGP